MRKKHSIVGFIVAHMREDGGYISYVAVLPAERKRGLGEAMVKYVQEIFASLGANRITLHVRTTRTAAIALYRKLGYIIDATREDYYSNGDSAYVMSLNLSE